MDKIFIFAFHFNNWDRIGASDERISSPEPASSSELARWPILASSIEYGQTESSTATETSGRTANRGDRAFEYSARVFEPQLNSR